MLKSEIKKIKISKKTSFFAAASDIGLVFGVGISNVVTDRMEPILVCTGLDVKEIDFSKSEWDVILSWDANRHTTRLVESIKRNLSLGLFSEKIANQIASEIYQSVENNNGKIELVFGFLWIDDEGKMVLTERSQPVAHCLR